MSHFVGSENVVSKAQGRVEKLRVSVRKIDPVRGEVANEDLWGINS